MNLETLIRQAKPDYIHADSEEVTSIIIKKLLDSKPRRRKISVKAALIAAVIVATLSSAFSVNAATGGKLFGTILINKENKHIVKEPNYVSMQAVSSGTVVTPNKQPTLNSDIINKNQLETLHAGSVTNIALKKDKEQYSIPELLLTNNADLVIFTKTENSGWHLNKGEKLILQFTLDLKTSNYSDPTGEWMEIGYIKNGVLTTGVAKKEKEFTYTITADEGGDYYFYAENLSAGKIIISSGSIK